MLALTIGSRGNPSWQGPGLAVAHGRMDDVEAAEIARLFRGNQGWVCPEVLDAVQPAPRRSPSFRRSAWTVQRPAGGRRGPEISYRRAIAIHVRPGWTVSE